MSVRGLSSALLQAQALESFRCLRFKAKNESGGVIDTDDGYEALNGDEHQISRLRVLWKFVKR